MKYTILLLKMKSVDKSEIQISEQAEICTSDQIYKEQG